MFSTPIGMFDEKLPR